MASSPISHSVGRLTLRLIGADGSVAAESLLLPAAAAPDGVEICETGYVMEAGDYRFCLISDAPPGVVEAAAEIEGTRVSLALLGAPLAAPAGSPLAGCYLQMMEPSCGDQGGPFGMVYALVRIGLSLRLDDGSTLELTTLDIPCVARKGSPNRGREIDAMLRDLAMGDDEALTWMFSVAGGDASAQVWGITEKGLGGAGATEARLGAVVAALDEFEACLPAVRVQSARRVCQVDRLVPTREARRCGGAEASWLARHPESLVPHSFGPVRLADGRRFTPAQLAVSVPKRSTDTPENIAILGFLSGLADDLARLAQNLEARAKRAERAVTRLRRIDAPEAALPALTVTSLGARRLRSLADRTAALRVRAARIMRSYIDCMPEAAAACPGGTTRGAPRKTKVFCEVELYARLWHAMEGAGRARLDAVGREGVALQVLRLSDLYELYVLHRMLVWLRRAGFGPSVRCARPFEVGRYTVDDVRYRSHDGVAGVYRLERGAQRISLYYQPVLHGTEREEMGVTLHRTTVAHEGSYPFYTPDFVLEVEDPTGRSVYVLDAKYAARTSLLSTEMRHGSEKVNRDVSMFQIVALKYLLETVDARTGHPADAVWLLCGDAHCGLWRYQTSPWAQVRQGFRFSGIAGVAAGAECLDELFAEMGVELPAGIRPASMPVRTPPVTADPAVTEAHAPQAALEPASEPEKEIAPIPAGETAPEPTTGAAPELPGEHAPEPVQQSVPQPARGAVPDCAREAVPAIESEASSECETPSGHESSSGREGGMRDKPASPRKPTHAPGRQRTARPDASSPQQRKQRQKPASASGAPSVPKPAVGADDIARMLEVVPDPAWLYDVRRVRMMCGINHPLVREKSPGGAEAKAYAAVPFCGKTAYVRVKFTPVELNRLRRALLRFEAKPENRGSDTAAVAGNHPNPVAEEAQRPSPNALRGTGRAKGDSARETTELLARLWPCLVDPACLRDPRFCQRTFGINVPVVRDKLGPRDAASYREAELGDARVFVFSKANPVQLARLRKYAERIAGAVTDG